MSRSEWEQVVQRDDLVGGDIRTIEDGFEFRGPIESVAINGDDFEITTPWLARLSNGWKLISTDATIAVHVEESTPQETEGGEIFFFLPYIGEATIFPKGGSKLNPSEVEGLVL